MVDGSLWPLGRFHSLGIFGVDEVRDGIIISPFWRLLLLFFALFFPLGLFLFPLLGSLWILLHFFFN